MGPASEPGHIVVGVPLPVAVEDQIQMVQALGQYQGMSGVAVAVVAVH
jgi:hypothetical protein